jgi:hypothetical protein
MRVVHADDLQSQDQLGNYKLRDSVIATPCDDGVNVVDTAGNGVATYAAPAYLIVDPATSDGGEDTFHIIPADTFEALYSYESPVEPAAKETAQTTSPGIVHNPDGSVAIEGVTYNQAQAPVAP